MYCVLQIGLQMPMQLKPPIRLNAQSFMFSSLTAWGWFLQLGGGHGGLVKRSDHLSVHGERVASSAAEDTAHVNGGGFQHGLWHILRSQQRSVVEWVVFSRAVEIYWPRCLRWVGNPQGKSGPKPLACWASHNCAYCCNDFSKFMNLFDH